MNKNSFSLMYSIERFTYRQKRRKKKEKSEKTSVRKIPTSNAIYNCINSPSNIL